MLLKTLSRWKLWRIITYLSCIHKLRFSDKIVINTLLIGSKIYSISTGSRFNTLRPNAHILGVRISKFRKLINFFQKFSISIRATVRSKVNVVSFIRASKSCLDKVMPDSIHFWMILWPCLMKFCMKRQSYFFFEFTRQLLVIGFYVHVST